MGRPSENIECDVSDMKEEELIHWDNSETLMANRSRSPLKSLSLIWPSGPAIFWGAEALRLEVVWSWC
jgi:hypothetical protein